MQAIEQSLFHTREPYIPASNVAGISSPQASLENVLSSILPSQTEENKTTKTRKHLGKIGHLVSDEQIECITAEFQFLIDTWLDEYEKEVFKGMTLREVLNGG